MENLLIIIFLIFGVIFVFIISAKIKREKLNYINTYRAIFIRSILHFFIVLILSLLIYLFSSSVYVTISIGVLLLFGVVGGCLYSLISVNNNKRW